MTEPHGDMVYHVRETVGNFPIIEGKILDFFENFGALKRQSNRGIMSIENGFDCLTWREEELLVGALR